MDERNIDLEGLLFDYEQYKQRWPKFWESDKGVLLFLLAFCERDPESKQFTYLDFIENFYSMFEFELVHRFLINSVLDCDSTRHFINFFHFISPCK
jgi:hypothetical protein